MSLEPGTRLGPYEVLAPIGETPGDRYKASDTRRNRVVALKVLPPDLSGQPDVKARLERETRTISSLNHPNISTPIDIGHQDPATDFVVTEYVEGETLAARLLRGPLALGEALSIGLAIADSLDKAHRLGVVHGGLNPSTVMLTPGGPKLLDFGLARLNDDGASRGLISMATTRMSVALSDVPPSSAAYLAPEQFTGAAIDHRADIFALGTVLYEMVVGRPAFQEKTQALLVAAVQSVDPEPVSKLLPGAPPALDYLLRRCLNKDPAQRLQTALDVTTEMRWIATGDAEAGGHEPTTIGWWRRDRIVWAALATAALVALGLSATTFSTVGGVGEPQEVHFLASTLPQGTTPIAISPDGRWLAASVNAGPIYVLSLDSVASQVLIDGSGVGTPFQPFFSHDSRSIGYFSDGKLRRIDIGGGPPQIICDVPPQFSAGTWNSEGVILFPASGVIQRVLAAGGQPTPITMLDESKHETEHLGPSFLPDGRRFLFLAVSSQPNESAVYVGSLDSAERTRVLASESKAVYAAAGPGEDAPGYLLFNRGDTVFAQSFDTDTLTLAGEPIRVASGVPLRVAPAGVGTSSAITRSANFAVSLTGVLAYRTGGTPAAQVAGNEEPRSLYWFDRNGQTSPVTGTTGGYAGIDLSPDGKRFAVHRHEVGGGDNWIFDFAQGRMQRLTFDVSQDNSSPVWSPDGTKVAFASRRNNRWGLYVKLADGSGAEELLTESDEPKSPVSWSPDGKSLVYSKTDRDGDVWAVPLDGDKKPVALLRETYPERGAQVSHDGNWIAYESQETGRPEIYIRPFPVTSGTTKWQVSTDGGQYPRWRRDGKELFFYFNNNMIAADIRVVGTSIEPGVPRVLFGLAGPSAISHSGYNRYAVTADGQRFLLSQQGAAGGATAGGLADNIAAIADQGGGGVTSPSGVTVVLNWPQMLKQK